MELLILLARCNPTVAQIERIRALAQIQIAWSGLLDLAGQHKVHPLVYWNMERYIRDAVSAPVLNGLKTLFGLNAMLNMRMKKEYQRIATQMRLADIEPFLVRGPVLALELYDDLTLREFKDIDLLVRAREYQTASDILTEMGYTRKQGIDDNSFNYTFRHAERKFEVELHWALDSPFVPVEMNADYYWEHARIYQTQDATVTTFQPDDLLLMLCFHGVKHRWHRLKWLCDIDVFVEKHRMLDWQAVLHKANALRIRRVLLHSLLLSQQLFGTVLPPVIVAAIDAEPVVKSLALYIERWLFTQNEERLIDQARGIYFYLLVREHAQDWLPSIQHALQYPRSPITRALQRLLPVHRLAGSPKLPSPTET